MLYVVANKQGYLLLFDYEPQKNIDGTEWVRSHHVPILNKADYPQFSGLTFDDEPVKVDIFPINMSHQTDNCPFCKLNKK